MIDLNPNNQIVRANDYDWTRVRFSSMIKEKAKRSTRKKERFVTNPLPGHSFHRVQMPVAEPTSPRSAPRARMVVGPVCTRENAIAPSSSPPSPRAKQRPSPSVAPSSPIYASSSSSSSSSNRPGSVAICLDTSPSTRSMASNRSSASNLPAAPAPLATSSSS